MIFSTNKEPKNANVNTQSSFKNRDKKSERPEKFKQVGQFFDNISTVASDFTKNRFNQLQKIVLGKENAFEMENCHENKEKTEAKEESTQFRDRFDAEDIRKDLDHLIDIMNASYEIIVSSHLTIIRASFNSCFLGHNSSKKQ